MSADRVMWEENQMPEFRTRFGHGHGLRTQIQATCRAGLARVTVLTLHVIAEPQ